jgi:Na+/H+ antiporter NhaD/arsenite permease-like protein
MNHLAIYVVFILVYLLIASRRLSLIPIGRPAGALLGAVLMVVFGAPTPSETYQAVDHHTILLLFGTMVLTVYLERARFFDWVAHGALSVCRTPARLFWATALLSGGLSSLLVNDTACLFLTPVVISACNRAGLPLGPYLIALATSANIGSAATLAGNPQNMIIGSMSGLAFSRFIGLAGPAAGVGLFLNGLLLWIYYGRSLPQQMGDEMVGEAPQRSDNLWLVIVVTMGVIGGFFMGFHLGYTTLAGVMVLILADLKDPGDVFGRVDWTLLLFSVPSSSWPVLQRRLLWSVAGAPVRNTCRFLTPGASCFSQRS